MADLIDHGARVMCGLLIAGILLMGSGAASAQPAAGKSDDRKSAATVDGEESTSAGTQAEPAVQGATKAAVDRSSILRAVVNANPILWPLAICSVVTVGYVLERWLALRRDRVVPREFADRFLERLSTGKLDRERALELCRAHDSPAARVFAMVVGAWGQSGAAIRQMVSHDAAGEVVELKRNLTDPERGGDAGASSGFARERCSASFSHSTHWGAGLDLHGGRCSHAESAWRSWRQRLVLGSRLSRSHSIISS